MAAKAAALRRPLSLRTHAARLLERLQRARRRGALLLGGAALRGELSLSGAAVSLLALQQAPRRLQVGEGLRGVRGRRVEGIPG